MWEPGLRTMALVLTAKGLRTFCYGALGIVIPLHLAALGMGAPGIGLAVTLTLAGSALMTVALRRPVERHGGRVVLVALTGFILAAGALLATTHAPALVVLAAVLGNVAVGAGETGPFLSIEQVLVTRSSPAARLTVRMSLYYLVGYGAAALGALSVSAVARLAAGGADAETASTSWYRGLFAFFAVSGLAQAAL